MNLVRKSLTGLLAAVIGTAGLIVPAAAEEATFVQQITGQAYVGDAGTMVESFDIKVSDVSRYADLQAEDFDITGNYDGYPVNEQGRLYRTIMRMMVLKSLSVRRQSILPSSHSVIPEAQYPRSL